MAGHKNDFSVRGTEPTGAQSIADISREPLIILDEKRHVLFANRAFYRKFGISESETHGRLFDDLQNGSWRIAGFREALETLIHENTEIEDLEIDRTFPGIGRRIMRLNARKVAWRDTGEQILIAIEDMTEAAMARRRVAYAESRYRQMIETLNCIIIGIDEAGTVTFLNPFSAKLFGYAPEEVVGRPLVGTLLPETDQSGQNNADLLTKVLADPASYPFVESIGRTSIGEDIWIAWSATRIKDAEGGTAEILICGDDITPEHRQRIRTAEAYRMLDNAPDAVARLDAGRRYLFVNRAFSDNAGRPVDEIIGRPLDPAFDSIFDEVEAAREERVFETEYGGRFFKASVVPEIDAEGRITSFNAYVRDISQRKAAEARLKEEQERFGQSEERFRSILENSLDAAYRRDLYTDAYDYISPAIERITGFTPEEFSGLSLEAVLDRMHPEHAPAVTRELESFRESDRSSGLIEYTFCAKGGDYRWLADHFRVIRDEAGNPRYRIGVVRDITGRKEMEEMMLSSLETAEKRASEAEAERRIIETVFDNVPEGFLLVDAETRRVLMVSRYLTEFVGMDRKEFEGMPVSKYCRLLDVSDLNGTAISETQMPIWRSLHHGETIVNETYRLRDKNGEAITVMINAAPVRSPDGRIIRGIASWRNIEPLKRAEEKLRQSRDAAREAMRNAEERQRILETILVSIPEGITIVKAPEGRLQLVSNHYENFVGIPADRLLQSTLEEHLDTFKELMRYPDRKPMEKESYPAWRALKKGEVVLDEEWFVHCNGSRAVVSVIAAPVRDEQGEITHAVMSWRDITENKEMEAALRRNEFEFRTLVENSPDIIMRFDSRLRYQFVNTAYERMTGMAKEQFVGRTNRELGMPEEQSGQWEDGIQKAIDTGRETNTEISFLGIFGKRFFWGRNIPEFEKNGRVQSVMVVARDITERKQAEEHIRYVSFHDSVTGLYNRAYFEEEIKRLDTERSLPVSFIMGDVNNLKLVNDAFGHNEGDRLLRLIADILVENCRDEDIIARWGGDEFAMVLPGTDVATAERICNRIRATAEIREGTVVGPSIALGVAEKRLPDDNIYQIIRRAEEHMYENKLAGSRKNQQSVISSLKRRVEERWPQFDAHLERTKALAKAFGKMLDFSESQLEDLLLMIELHDIGKAVVPDHLLQKPDRLTNREWEAVKRHPETGYRIVKTFAETARVSEAILAQRERWDGTGYPRGLKHQEIPYLSRVFSIIDAYDIITHERPYKRAFTREEALEELRRAAGKQFDPQLSESFISTVST